MLKNIYLSLSFLIGRHSNKYHLIFCTDAYCCHVGPSCPGAAGAAKSLDLIVGGWTAVKSIINSLVYGVPTNARNTAIVQKYMN